MEPMHLRKQQQGGGNDEEIALADLCTAIGQDRVLHGTAHTHLGFSRKPMCTAEMVENT